MTRDYGARPTFLLRGHAAYGLAWSPSGREIAFTESSNIFLVDLRTGRVKRLRRGSYPSWSPDGKRIVFARNGSIYVMNRDGSALRLVLRRRGA
jgi:Tol biopolymer transport system component